VEREREKEREKEIGSVCVEREREREGDREGESGTFYCSSVFNDVLFVAIAGDHVLIALDYLSERERKRE